MKYILFVLSLVFIDNCHAQNQVQTLNKDNFKKYISNFDFSNINNVSADDFKKANLTLKEIEKNLLDKKGEYTSATYWNYCHVFYKLGYFELIEVPLILTAESNESVFCELWNGGYADKYQEYTSRKTLIEMDSKCNANDENTSSRKVDDLLLTDIKIEDYKDRLNVIANNDQKRGSIGWDKQNLIDSLNRIELDLLFNQYGFPKLSILGKDAITTTIMITHHSSNCVWNEKWLIRLLKNHEELREHENLVKFLFLRTFDLKTGFCKLSQNTKDELNASLNSQVLSQFDLKNILE